MHGTTEPERGALLQRMNWKLMLVMGIVLIIGGIVALLNPFVATITAAAIAAYAFLVAGILQLWLAIRGEHGDGGRLIAGLLGALLILFALSLFAQPISGIISLTLLVAAFFLATGLVRIWLAFQMRRRRSWGWLLASGIISAALGVFVIASLPEAAAAFLGILLGVELLSSGAACVALGLAARFD